MTRTRLSPTDLRWTCAAPEHDCFSPARGGAQDAGPGQRRAVEALDLGLSIAAPGFNVYVSGEPGTGRTFTVSHTLERLAPADRRHVDRLFVHDFDEPSRPTLIEVPRGRGRAFEADLRAFVDDVPAQIRRGLENEILERTRSQLVDERTEEAKSILREVDHTIGEAGFGVVQLPHHPEPIKAVVFVFEGKPVPFDLLRGNDELRAKFLGERVRLARERGEEVPAEPAERDAWLESQIAKLEEKSGELYEALGKALAKAGEIEDRTRREVAKLETDAVRGALLERAKELVSVHPGEAIWRHVARMVDHMMDHLFLFRETDQPALWMGEERDEIGLWMYGANVIQGDGTPNGAPVIVERHPSFTNLFGTIERRVTASGVSATNFTRIRGGSLLRADGGFLVLYAKDILLEPGVWRTLVRTLVSGQLEIQPAESALYLVPSALKPDSVPIDVKVVLIGEDLIHEILRRYDEDFAKIFKVKAELDSSVDMDSRRIAEFAESVRTIERTARAPPLTPDALAALLEEAVRASGRKNRIAMCFQDVEDVVEEASFAAKGAGADRIDRETIRSVVRARRQRHARIEEHLARLLAEDVLLVATDGERIGQINGLAVYAAGPRAFGKPTRITASVGVGNGGIVNIEREAKLSGPTHDKGVMILGGYLRQRYGAERPLGITASLAFEQSYGGIEGDSASLAELLVLLSSIAQVPIRQSVAVTGSVNQLGDVQAIGGVNEKVEGFFDLCEARGLTGNQSCIIPRANALDLMLEPPVVAAAAEERFEVWAVDTVDDAIPLVFGMDAEELHARVAERLEALSKAAMEWAMAAMTPKPRAVPRLVASERADAIDE